MSTAILPGDVERFRDGVREILGLDFDDAKVDQLAEALHGRLEATGCSRVDDYLRRLTAGTSPEWGALAERLTVSETYFFRYRDHFRAFTEARSPPVHVGRAETRAHPIGGRRVR